MNRMKGCMNRRGLSPVIASVLLILLVLVLASILFVWARGFISEQVEKFGEPVEESCRNVNFEVSMIGNDLINSELEVLNKGDIDIRYLEIRMIKGGDSVLQKFDFPIDALALKPVTELVSFEMPGNLGVTPDEIIVYPALIGNVVGKASNSIYTCIDSGVSIL